jgi:hypothetical protein
MAARELGRVSLTNLVATIEAFAPPPTVGLPVARRGGQSIAQAPVHALFVTRATGLGSG